MNTRTQFWAVIAAALLAQGCAGLTAKPAWHEPYRLSKTYADAGQWETVIELLNRAIAADPVSDPNKPAGMFRRVAYYPYLDLGRAYLAIDRLDEASLYCDKALSEGNTPLSAINDCLARVESRSKTTARSLPHYPAAERFDIPEFPWPPPKASAKASIPSSMLAAPGRAARLGDAAERLERALFASGYEEFSYFHIPQGFAVVTRLEQFYPDGRPKEAPARWVARLEPQPIFSLASYLKALFTAQKGYYRILVFFVTAAPINQGGKEVSRDEAAAWLHGGANMLPSSIGTLALTKDHYCMAFIYEFEQMTRDHPAALKIPGMLFGRAHLEKSAIWKNLEQFARQG